MKHWKRLLIAAFILTFAVSPAAPAMIANAKTETSSSALSIEPTKNYLIKPGKSVTDKLTIRNLSGGSDLYLSLRLIDFTYTDDTGTPKLFLDQNREPTTWSLRPYTTLPDHVTVPKNGSKTIKYTISIPAGHGAGSLYSAILYSSGSGEGGNVGLSASGTTLVFVDIPGKVHEDLKLQKLGAYHEARTGTKAGYTFITTSMPQEIGYTLKNSGNVTESPVGAITLTDMFGRDHKIENINPNGLRALIGQARTFTSCIDLQKDETKFQNTSTPVNRCAKPHLWPGRYSVYLDAYYGHNGNQTQEIVGHASFWYLPLWFILLVIFIILIAVFYGWRLKTRLSGPKQHSHRRSSTTRRRR